MRQTEAYIDDLASRGCLHFTTEAAQHSLGLTRTGILAALRRLKRQGRIADPHRGFHVIVPAEYRRLGCLPPEQFVPQLMDHLGLHYYAALLTAARYHGAAHQQPQVFQVMVARPRRRLECGQVRVQFMVRKSLQQTTTVDLKTPRGPLRLSSPEETALELVGYPDHSGGLDNVATVLDELSPALGLGPLAVAARNAPIAWVQRLGYLLELTGHGDVAAGLAEIVGDRARSVAPLVRAKSTRGAARSDRWKMLVNEPVEADL